MRKASATACNRSVSSLAAVLGFAVWRRRCVLMSAPSGDRSAADDCPDSQEGEQRDGVALLDDGERIQRREPEIRRRE